MPAMQDPSHNVLVKDDGTTVVTKSALLTALGTAVTDDKVYQIPDGWRLREKGPLPGDDSAVLNYQIAAEGNLIKSSEIDAMFPAMTLDTVAPATGAAAGGTAVTLTGTNFKKEGTTVTFGGTAATSVVVVDSTTITCVTPAKTAGAYNVVVTGPAGTATKTNGFTYS